MEFGISTIKRLEKLPTTCGFAQVGPTEEQSEVVQFSALATWRPILQLVQ
jgi:hypothetical protein